jgi:uncharacterized protein involved in exopolysaccharide biosynthesis
VDAPATPEFFRVVQTIWRARPVVTACIVVVTGLFAAFAFLSPPVYRSEVLVVPNKGRAAGADGLAQLAGQFGGLASLAGVRLGSDNTDKDVAMSLLTGREFLGKFVEQEHLLPILFAKRWDVSKRQWHASWLHAQPPTIDDAVKLLQKRVLSVTEDRRTGLIRLNVEWRERTYSAAWANKLISNVNEEMRARATVEARRSQEYLRQQLQRTDVFELTQAVYRLLEVELKNEMVASVTTEYAFKVVDPARTPQQKDFVRPRRALLIVFGAVVGVAAGIACALLMNAVRVLRSRRA